MQLEDLPVEALLTRDLYDKHFTAHQLFRELKRRLKLACDELAVLRAASGETDSEIPLLIQSVSGVRRRILLRLYHAYPVLVNTWDLAFAMGSRDPSVDALRVQMTKLRQDFGKDTFVCVTGEGYTLSSESYERIKDSIPSRKVEAKHA